MRQFVLDAAVKPYKPLTDAEERVADLIARGWSYKAVGDRLHTTSRTIEHHVEAIASKLPDDGLAPKERVLIWALCRALHAHTRAAA